MEKLKMCRICLVEDVGMYEVANKDLQEMYEKLTDIPFATEDCIPMLACFFCYTKLKQCCLFQRKCLKAEEVFTQMLNGGYEQIPLEFQGDIEFYGGFIKTPIEHMSIDDVCQTVSGAIGEQQPAVCDVKDDIVLKEEYLSDEVKVEYLEDSCQYQEDIPSHHSEPESEDDVPLMQFKIEVEEEQEVHKKKTRAPAAKKPKLDIRKTKPEDTITDKQKKTGRSDSKIILTTRIKTSKPVSKVRDAVISHTIAKPEVNNSILNIDTVIIEESPNKLNVKELINTAIDTYFRDNSNQDHFGNSSDDINKHKKLCESYKCDICQLSFIHKNDLKSHHRTHTGDKPYKCDICQRSFTLIYDLNRHALIHTGVKPYKCDICQRNFIHKHNLKSHIRTHTGDKPYKCEICQRSFTQKGHLKSHHLTHTGEKPYNCGICRRSYKCDICQHIFIHKNKLKSHIIRTHTDDKPYKCDICQRCFTLKYDLNRHVRIHTGDKPYKCDICQRNFNQKHNLKTHVRTHTGDKPYKCDICQRSFTLIYDLNRHARIHTGDKPYKCDICQRSFNRKESLKFHNNIHTTGEKPRLVEGT